MDGTGNRGGRRPGVQGPARRRALGFGVRRAALGPWRELVRGRVGVISWVMDDGDWNIRVCDRRRPARVVHDVEDPALADARVEEDRQQGVRSEEDRSEIQANRYN